MSTSNESERKAFESHAAEYFKCSGTEVLFLARDDRDRYIQEQVESAWQFYQRGLSDATAWISVEERLPEDGDSALIYVPGWEDKYLEYRVAWINYDVSPPQWISCGEAVTNVTHWQPRPAPPVADSIRSKGGT